MKAGSCQSPALPSLEAVTWCGWPGSVPSCRWEAEEHASSLSGDEDPASLLPSLKPPLPQPALAVPSYTDKEPVGIVQLRNHGSLKNRGHANSTGQGPVSCSGKNDPSMNNDIVPEHGYSEGTESGAGSRQQRQAQNSAPPVPMGAANFSKSSLCYQLTVSCMTSDDRVQPGHPGCSSVAGVQRHRQSRTELPSGCSSVGRI